MGIVESQHLIREEKHLRQFDLLEDTIYWNTLIDFSICQQGATLSFVHIRTEKTVCTYAVMNDIIGGSIRH